MKSIIPVAFALFSLHGFISCKKTDRELTPPVDPPPTNPVVSNGSAPSSLKFLVNRTDYLSMQLKYAELPNKVSVYIDDTLTTDPYDKLYATYSFDNNGYLSNNVLYKNNGDVLHDISISRTNNSISGITIKHEKQNAPGILVTDAFQVAFSDSSNGYKVMKVDYGNYFDSVPVNISFTYLDQQLTRTNAGLYTSDNNAVFFPSFSYNYDASGSLINKWSDSYYGIDFFYQDEGKGLDSLFELIGGKDWQFLEAILNYDENNSLFFYPLYITLSQDGMDLNVHMHQYAPFSLVRSVPSGPEYPTTGIFDFQNEFDDKGRIIKTNIINNGEEYGAYQFGY